MEKNTIDKNNLKEEEAVKGYSSLKPNKNQF